MNLLQGVFYNFSVTNLCAIPISMPTRLQWCKESKALRVAFFTTISRPLSEILERLFQIPQKNPNITSEVNRVMVTLRRTFTPRSSCWWASFSHLAQVRQKYQLWNFFFYRRKKIFLFSNRYHGWVKSVRRLGRSTKINSCRHNCRNCSDLYRLFSQCFTFCCHRGSTSTSW